MVQNDNNLWSTPVKSRGHYFTEGSYWSAVDIANKPFYFHNSFTILSWIKITASGDHQTILSKNKADTTTADAENLLSLYVDTNTNGDRDLGLSIDNGSHNMFDQSTAQTISNNEWTFAAVVVNFNSTNRSSTINMWVNNISQAFRTSDDEFMYEAFNSQTLVGTERNYEVNQFVEADFFIGHIYQLKVYNVAKTISFVDDQVTVSVVDVNGNDSCTGACDFCPEDGDCINDCALGTFDANCSQCTDYDNCVSNGTFGRLCNNPLCLRCETFDPNTCFECVDHALDPANNSDDCDCDATHVEDQSIWQCTCAVECSACTTLDRYNCSECAIGYFKQVGATFCYDHCPTRFTTSGQTCVAPTGDADLMLMSFNFLSAFDEWTSTADGA